MRWWLLIEGIAGFAGSEVIENLGGLHPESEAGKRGNWVLLLAV